ncbi:hypothetical protein O3W44_22895 [Pantoea sp. LMR881]|nr:hypothetical protein [Pantoea sp. LMR881]MCZ4061377.1 hypothetical protein [Pantoea sp. LMR881]
MSQAKIKILEMPYIHPLQDLKIAGKTVSMRMPATQNLPARKKLTIKPVFMRTTGYRNIYFKHFEIMRVYAFYSCSSENTKLMAAYRLFIDRQNC